MHPLPLNIARHQFILLSVDVSREPASVVIDGSLCMRDLSFVLLQLLIYINNGSETSAKIHLLDHSTRADSRSTSTQRQQPRV